MTIRAKGRSRLASAIVMSAALAAFSAEAQTTATNALHGFFQNRDKSLKIEGNVSQAQLGAGVAIYGDNIRSVQVMLGDTVLKCRFLTVYYQHDARATSRPSMSVPPAAATSANSRRPAKSSSPITIRPSAARAA
jgi:lipopolysaccharide export system protein LptA